MKRIRQRDTAPELEVRRGLAELGLRYRLCPSDLPGRPDLANKSKRWAIFVHGCFWHGHRGCRLATVPKSNRQFWIEKLAANARRDRAKTRALEAIGFRVFVVWQCELSDRAVLSRLGSILRRT
jgi:DNA mismatch endonuclease, patch repair protein